MSGAIFDWHRGQFPQFFYCRDKDGREIDLLIQRDRTLHPVEIKKTALPGLSGAWTYPALKRFKLGIGAAAAVCLTQRFLPLGPGINAVPAGFI